MPVSSSLLRCALAVLVALLGAGPLLPAQSLISSDPVASPGGLSHRSVVRDSRGALWAATVVENASALRSVVLWVSFDGGATWVDSTVVVNDDALTATGTARANGCAIAIDSQDLLHITWTAYYYPSAYQQNYRSFDTAAFALSPTVDITSTVGATSGARCAAVDITVDANDFVYLSAQSRSSWVESLLVSTAPGAAGGTFTNLGSISPSASSQQSRIVVDSANRVHAFYYRNSSSGVYEHRIYDPASGGWQNSTVLGNTTPSRDLYGVASADMLGGVHAVWMEDADAGSTWTLRYDRWTPDAGWSGSPILIGSYPSASYSGISSARMFAMAAALDGTAFITLRQLDQGGSFDMLGILPGTTSPLLLANLGPATTANNRYLFPTMRGSLWPAANTLRDAVDIAWHERATTGSPPYEYRFQRISGFSSPGAILSLAGTAEVGATVPLRLYERTSPSAFYIMGLSERTMPGVPLGDGRTVPLDASSLFFTFTSMPNNGVLNDNIGTLDTEGERLVDLNIPPFPALSGLTFYAAAVLLDPAASAGVSSVSNSLAITPR